jgi:hypothetical protein
MVESHGRNADRDLAMAGGFRLGQVHDLELTLLD